MRAVRRRNTAAELALRRRLWRGGLRYRIHVENLPGTPDLVFARARVVIFVDGDYWHGRIFQEHGLAALKRSFRTTHRDFWIAKILRNVKRDSRQRAELGRMGWKVIELWEQDILADPQREAAKILRSLRRNASPDATARDGRRIANS